MTLAEAVEIIVRRTRHGRYRWLCSDKNPDIAQRDGYRALVLRMAGEPEPPPQPVAPLASSIRATIYGFRQCLYSSHKGCGCTGTHCYRHGRIVGLADCIDCLKGPK
jgi:hypothetical protein